MDLSSDQHYNLLLIDCSANLVNKKFGKDLDAILKRAKDAGVQKIIVPGSSLKTNSEALRLSRIYPGDIYCTAGIHPYDSKKMCETPDHWNQLKQIAESDEVIAIGPCGIADSEETSTLQEQLLVFETQVKLACDVQKPLLLYTRSSHKEIQDILSKYPNLPAVIVKGFTGSAEEAQQYISRGYYISLNGFICKEKTNAGIIKLLEDKLLPVDRLLVETDSPFTYPNTRASKLPQAIKAKLTERSLAFLHRYCTFQRNEPCSLPVIVELIAAFMEKNPEEIALATTFNALKLFNLSKKD